MLLSLLGKAQKKGGLRCACLNVDGLRVNKFKYIKTIMLEKNLNVIFFAGITKTSSKIDIDWEKYLKDYEFISENGIECGILLHKTVQKNKIKVQNPVGGN